MELILNALVITAVQLVWECFTVLEVLLTLFATDVCHQCACCHLHAQCTTPSLSLVAFFYFWQCLMYIIVRFLLQMFAYTNAPTVDVCQSERTVEQQLCSSTNCNIEPSLLCEPYRFVKIAYAILCIYYYDHCGHLYEICRACKY